ncbi:MAG: hypothetical protein VKJ46_16125 [Leptolyngbyaceae bacterium]|nr:hypothetical protein [Leptolyngbyaceae bacterium]
MGVIKRNQTVDHLLGFGSDDPQPTESCWLRVVEARLTNNSANRSNRQ